MEAGPPLGEKPGFVLLATGYRLERTRLCVRCRLGRGSHSPARWVSAGAGAQAQKAYGAKGRTGSTMSPRT